MMQSGVFEDEDSINCGRCGQKFRSFDVFKSHKFACPMRATPFANDVFDGPSSHPVDDAACAETIDAAPIVPLASVETLDADALTTDADVVGVSSESIDLATLPAEADTSATSLPPVDDLPPDVFPRYSSDPTLLQQPQEQEQFLQDHTPHSLFLPKTPQPDRPVVYFNNVVVDRSVLSSLLGVSESRIDVNNIGLSGAVNYPPIEIISTTADAPVLIPSSTSHVDFAQHQLQQHQHLLQTTLQQLQQSFQLPYHDVISTFAVNEEDITHLSVLVDVNNGFIASHDLNVSSSSIMQNVNEMRTLRSIAPLVHLTADLGGGTPELTPRPSQKVPWRRSLKDSAIAVVDGGMLTAKLTVDQSSCSKSEADDGALHSKSFKKPRNKVMCLPAKNPLNLTAKSHYSDHKPSGRGKTGGATMTQTQTTRVFKLPCPYCQKLFCKQFDLDAHVRSHTGEKPFQCCICGKCFSQKSNVKKHLTTHKVWPEGRVSMPASRLGKVAVEAVSGASNSSKNVESVVESLLSSYFCQFCNEKFPHWPKLSSHLAAVHKDRQVFKCRVLTCPATFLEVSDLIEHLNGNHDPAEIKYGCEDCGMEFDSLRDLGLHYYQHASVRAGGGVDRDDDEADMEDGDEEGVHGSLGVPNFGKSVKKSSFSAKYICPHCGDKFTRDETLKAHLATVSHFFPCPICSVAKDKEAKLNEADVFTSERILRKHMKECHAMSKHVCSQCSKPFKTKALLNVHLKAHGPSTFECEDPLCRRKFKRKDQLARHRKTVHGKRRFRCPHKTICSQRFGRKDQLRVHLQHAHETREEERRPWKCGDCDKGFLTKHHLVEHEMIHGDNRRFRCVVCGRGFSRQKQMDVHRCDNPGRTWKGKRKREESGEEICDDLEKKGNDTAWRKSTLLRSGRKTKPTIRPDEAGFEELDRAFQPVVKTRNPPEVATESLNFRAVVDASFGLDNDVEPGLGMGVNLVFS